MPRDIITLQVYTINENHIMNGSWDMEQNFFSFWTTFWPFSKFWKNERKSENIIITHKCTINDNHLMYGSWDMKHDRQIFCHFGPFFVLLPHQQPKKSKIWKNEKKYLEISPSASKIMIICYSVLEIWCVTDVIVIFHFRLFFANLLP